MINKAMLVSAALGAIVGTILLVFELTYSAWSIDSPPPLQFEELQAITFTPAGKTDSLYQKTLAIFGVEDAEIATNGNTGDLLSEDVTIRIVAQARVGDKQNTLLEVASKNETKQIQVSEGSEVNGLVIKAITDKQLTVEKDGVEHNIKLFHPKELNLTKTE